MTVRTSALFLIAALTVSAAKAADSVLLNDNFTDGTTTGWANSGGTLTVVNDAGIGGGNAMNIVTISGNRDAAKTFSPAITLGTGDFVRLTIDYRFTYLTNVNAGVQFRFMDSTDSSYSGFGLNPGSTAASSSWFLRNGAVEGAKFANSFTNDLTARTMTFTVVRNADNTLTYTVSWAGGPTFTKTGAIVTNFSDFTFDRLQIAFTSASKCDGLIIDNAVITSSVPTAPQPVLRLISFATN